MPKIKRDKSVRLIHPNSRKALQIAREKQKSNKRMTKVKDKATKIDVKVKQLLWFQENLNSNLTEYKLSDFKEIVSKYLGRFDSELEQIEIIRGIGRRAPTQHAARERAIMLSKEHEAMLMQSTGLDVPDLLDPETCRDLREWDGDPMVSPKFKSIKVTNNMFNNVEVVT